MTIIKVINVFTNKLANMKRMPIVLCFLFSLSSNAQIKELSFSDTMDISTINHLLETNDFPILLNKINTESSEINLFFISESDSIEVKRIYDNLEYVSKFICMGEKYYLCLFYSYTGFDYFYIYKFDSNTIYKSKKFNFEQDEGYNFLYNTFDMKTKMISIIKQETKQIKNIHFSELFSK